MPTPLREEGGFMLVELVVATVVLSLAIMALMAGYDSAFLSLHTAAKQSAAATLADNQLELYSALSYSAIGLDTTTLSYVKAQNSTYTTDESGLDGAAKATDHTISGCGTASQCLPVQTLTGNDKHSYTLETFVRDVTDLAFTGRSERMVTVFVRDSAGALVTQASNAYDAGPSS
jgi:Tfp pilus assembly protein PilE